MRQQLAELEAQEAERKQAEEALRESEADYRRLFKLLPVGVTILDLKGVIIYCNSAVYIKGGFPEGEFVGKHFSKIASVRIKDIPKYIRVFNSIVRGKTPEPFEAVYQHKDGTTGWTELNVDLVKVGGKQRILVIQHDITERKQAEEKQQAIIKTALDGFWACNLEGKFLEVNDSYCKITGYTREELLEMSIQDIEAIEKPEQTAQRIKKIMEHGSDRFETQHKRKDGKIIDIEISVNYLNIEEGQMFVFVRDITERKQAEEALANEAIRRRILIEQSRDGIVVLDQNGNVYESNQRFAEMLGYSLEEVRQLQVWDWEFQFPPEQVLDMIQSVDETGDHFETQHRRKDGTIYDVEISTNGAVFAGEKLIFCVCRDITGRKRAEEALRESEEKFSAAFRSSPDMMTIVNLQDGKYAEVNDSFVHFSGYSREELIGHSNDEFNMWVNLEERDRMTRLLEEQGTMRHEEYDFRTKSGEICTWLCSADIINIGGESCMLAVATDITERKKAQEALRESEERFSKAFHASPGSMSISRLKDGTFIEVNESFLRDKGYTREEVIGRSSAELGIWKNEEHRNQVLQMLQEQGRVHNEPTQFRTKSGEIRTGYMSAEFVNLGNEPCMIILTTDITRQKQAEEQLRLLSSVTRQVSDSIIITDPDFKITYINQAAQDLFGYSIEEVLGKGLGIFNDKAISKKARQKILRTLASGKVWSTTATKQRKDGRAIICDCRLTPLFDEKGETCSYIDVQRDITKTKEVEAKLQVHKQLIERILATMPEGVLVIESNGRILLANEAFYKIFHTGKKAIANKLLNEIIPVNQLFNLYKAVKQGNKENNTLEFRYQVKGLEKRIASVVTKMDGGRTLLTFTDVSQEREEEEKLYLTDRLASIGEMAAGLAHELNNPLTGVLALSQLLMDSDIPEEHKEDLECVYSEAKRAASIVKNVLLFARNNNYENGQASTNEVIRDVLRLREYEEKVSNITTATKLQENLPDIPMDKFQLQQVFLNLILNAEAAIKEANRPGKLSVTTERDNNHINIHFKDNGRGIKKHLLSRIFDPFFTTKDIGKGTGLGLSICYGIVVKHGGKISVKTRVNQGTTFTIRMPVAPQTV